MAPYPTPVTAVTAVTIAATALAGAGPARGADGKALRATYIATNPVQAAVDPASGEVRGPGAALAREIARRLDATAQIKGLASPAAVIDSVRSGEADIGLVAFDPARAAEVAFCDVYVLGQNTYLVNERAGFRAVADVDRAGVKVGVTARDTADLVLTRQLQAAEIVRNTTGTVETAVAWLRDGVVDAYGTNRQRLAALAAGHPGYRLLDDNFYGVPQSVIVAKANGAMCGTVNAAIAAARSSGVLARAIAEAALVGVDVAPPPGR